jgi:hypothetical protein
MLVCKNKTEKFCIEPECRVQLTLQNASPWAIRKGGRCRECAANYARELYSKAHPPKRVAADALAERHELVPCLLGLGLPKSLVKDFIVNQGGSELLLQQLIERFVSEQTAQTQSEPEPLAGGARF